MAKVRQVNTFFWDDPYIEDLCPLGKLLFLYLITTPLTNIGGSFEISVKKMAEHTGIDRSTISDLLDRFEKDGKCIYRDRWMLVVNTIEHQHWRSHETIKKGIIEIVSGSPDWVKHRLGVAYEWLSHLNPNPNPNLNSSLIPEEVAANAADAPDPVEKRIWKDGLDLLTKSGLKESQARPLLGRWARDFGKLELASAIAVAQAANPPDPKAYIGGIIRNQQKQAIASQVGKPDPDASLDAFPDCSTCDNARHFGEWPDLTDCPDCVGSMEIAL